MRGILLISFFLIIIDFFGQERTNFRNKSEFFLGVNAVNSSESKKVGFNAGFSKAIKGQKRLHYRIDAQYFSQFHNSTYHGSPEFKYIKQYYEDLSIQSLLITNMVSFRFYQKRKHFLYFDWGPFIGMNLWQHRTGFKYKIKAPYQYDEYPINKTLFLLPSSIGIQVGLGVRIWKFIIKPELRVGILNFDRLKKSDGISSQFLINSTSTANLNIAYFFEIKKKDNSGIK